MCHYFDHNWTKPIEIEWIIIISKLDAIRHLRVFGIPDFGMNISAADPSIRNVNGIGRQQSMEPSVSTLMKRNSEKLASRMASIAFDEKMFWLSYRWWSPPWHRQGNVYDRWSLSIYRHESMDSFFALMDDLYKILHLPLQTRILFFVRCSSIPSVKMKKWLIFSCCD